VFNLRAHKFRVLIAGTACLAAMASAPLAVTTLGEHGVAVPGLSSAQKLMALIDARSPGERQKGELTKTKNKQLAETKRERALGKVFPPKPSPVEQLAQVIAPTPPAPVEAVPPVAPLAPATVADVFSPSRLFASAPLVVGSAIVGGGGGGGSGGGGGGVPSGPPTSVVPPPPIAVVTSPVPEPGTWLMMLLGFGVVGASFRSRRHQRAIAA
jgi:hypothetical protein